MFTQVTLQLTDHGPNPTQPTLPVTDLPLTLPPQTSPRKCKSPLESSPPHVKSSTKKGQRNNS